MHGKADALTQSCYPPGAGRRPDDLKPSYIAISGLGHRVGHSEGN